VSGLLPDQKLVILPVVHRGQDPPEWQAIRHEALDQRSLGSKSTTVIWTCNCVWWQEMTITLVMLALATLLALGYTLYLVYIETSTDLPPRHQSLHPTTVFMDVPFRTPRSPPYRRNREL